MSTIEPYKRILLIIPYGGVGGIERLAVTFYKFLKQKGYQVYVIKVIQLPGDLVTFGEDERFLSTRDLHQMSSLGRLWFYLKSPWLLRRQIKKLGITQTISFGDIANIFNALTFTRECKTGSIHSLKSKELRKPTAFNRITKLGYKSFYKHLDHLICISNAIKRDLIENCGYKFPHHLKVIYNPHDLSFVRDQSLEILTEEFINTVYSQKTLLFLGRLSPVKAPWHLVKAFAELRRMRADVHLVFVGDGDRLITKDLKKLISDLKLDPYVFFLGRKNNPYPYIKHADVLALTSAYEGTPNVIAEAMALNTPVISTNCTDGIAEMMTLQRPEDLQYPCEVEAGMIVPLFSENETSWQSTGISEEEKSYARGIHTLLTKQESETCKTQDLSKLLVKYDVAEVLNQYLQVGNKKKHSAVVYD